MKTDSKIVIYTFFFNIITVIVFSLIYSSISLDNFKAINPKDKLTYIDFLFYSVTIQAGVGLPDITSLSNLSKLLAIFQQLILMSSAFILMYLFFEK